MGTEKTAKKILSSIGEADEYRRRADTVDALYCKELAHLALSAVSDPSAVFACLTGRDDTALSQTLSVSAGICRQGITGALFAKAFTDVCRARGLLPSVSEMFPHNGDSEPTTVALVTGGYADSALSYFRDEYKELTHTLLRPHHSDRVQNACDCVLDGDADFAIVPVRNDRDGLLRSFYRMLESFDLKILSVTSVETEEGRTRFALCGTDAAPLFPSPAYMEFSASGDDGFISDIADAVRLHGHSLIDVTLSPNGSEENRSHFTVRSGGDLRPTLLYLNLFHPSHNIIGVYGNTEDHKNGNTK